MFEQSVTARHQHLVSRQRFSRILGHHDVNDVVPRENSAVLHQKKTVISLSSTHHMPLHRLQHAFRQSVDNICGTAGATLLTTIAYFQKFNAKCDAGQRLCSVIGSNSKTKGLLKRAHLTDTPYGLAHVSRNILHSRCGGVEEQFCMHRIHKKAFLPNQTRTCSSFLTQCVKENAERAVAECSVSSCSTCRERSVTLVQTCRRLEEE